TLPRPETGLRRDREDQPGLAAHPHRPDAQRPARDQGQPGAVPGAPAAAGRRGHRPGPDQLPGRLQPGYLRPAGRDRTGGRQDGRQGPPQSRRQVKTWLLVLALAGAALAQKPAPPPRDTVELVESVPLETSLAVPGVRDTRTVWLEMIGAANRTL